MDKGQENEVMPTGDKEAEGGLNNVPAIPAEPEQSSSSAPAQGGGMMNVSSPIGGNESSVASDHTFVNLRSDSSDGDWFPASGGSSLCSSSDDSDYMMDCSCPACAFRRREAGLSSFARINTTPNPAPGPRPLGPPPQQQQGPVGTSQFQPQWNPISRNPTAGAVSVNTNNNPARVVDIASTTTTTTTTRGAGIAMSFFGPTTNIFLPGSSVLAMDMSGGRATTSFPQQQPQQPSSGVNTAAPAPAAAAAAGLFYPGPPAPP